GCSCTSLAIHAALRRSWQSVESLPIHRLHNLAELPQAVEAFDDDERFARFAAAHPDIIARLQAADVVYVNGEGTLHNVSAGAVGLLHLAYVARRRLEKPVRLINHSCYPDDTAAPSDSVASQLYRKVYRELDYVA